MLRFASALLLISACSSAPHPIQNANKTPMHYTLDPVHLHGGEGMHSVSQSWTTVKGSLEMQQMKATLTLDLTTQTSYIHCQPDPSSMQACAGPNDKDRQDTRTLALSGDGRYENGKLVISVRQDDQAATLTCDEKGKTLACTIDDEYTLFSSVGQRPGTVLFHL